MSQQNFDLESEEPRAAPPYVLEKWDAGAANEVSNVSIRRNSDELAMMETAQFLEISYPLQLDAFQEKRGIRLKDSHDRLVFGFP